MYIQTDPYTPHASYTAIHSSFTVHIRAPAPSSLVQNRLKLTMLIPPSSCRGGALPGPPRACTVHIEAYKTHIKTYKVHIYPIQLIYSRIKPYTVHIEPTQSIYKPRGGIQSIYSAYTVHVYPYRPIYSACIIYSHTQFIYSLYSCPGTFVIGSKKDSN